MPVAQECLLVVGAQDVSLAPTRTVLHKAKLAIARSGLAHGRHFAYGSEHTAATSQILIHQELQMMSFADFAWAVHSNFNLRAHSTCITGSNG